MKLLAKSAMLSFTLLASNYAFAVNDPLVECEGDLLLIKKWVPIVGCRKPPTLSITTMTLSRNENASIGKAEISIGSSGLDWLPYPDHLCDNPRGYWEIVVVDAVKLPRGSWDLYFSESKAARVHFTDAYDGSACRVDDK